jgi:hypothetical protein
MADLDAPMYYFGWILEDNMAEQYQVVHDFMDRGHVNRLWMSRRKDMGLKL